LKIFLRDLEKLKNDISIQPSFIHLCINSQANIMVNHMSETKLGTGSSKM
jgi:hypothetical protein